jgi:magnesium transporter
MLPLTVIAGIYGMNFDPDASPLNMPELRWTHGYAFALGLMAVTAIAMLVFFRRRRLI